MTEHEMLADRVLIKPLVETVSAGGVILPGDKEKPERGEIVLVGPGKKDVVMTLKIDDQVLFSKYSGVEVFLEKEKYLIMTQDDVLMKTKKV